MPNITMTLAQIGDDDLLIERAGEQLIAADVDSTTTIAEVREELLGEWELAVPSMSPHTPSLAEFMAAMDAELPIARSDEAYDPTLRGATTAWFLVRTKETVQ